MTAGAEQEVCGTHPLLANLSWQQDDATVWLVVALFVTCSMFAVFCAFLLGRFLQERLDHPWTGWFHRIMASHSRTFFPLPAELTWNWLVVRGVTPMAIQEILRLNNAAPATLEEAMAEITSRKLFISPSVNGWVLVFGPGLPDAFEDVDATFRFLTNLSQRAGHIQYFSLHRPTARHAWAMLHHGEVLRAYAWSERTIWNQGELTEAEKDLGMTCHDYATPPALSPFQQTRMRRNAEQVLPLAARWGIDPSRLLSKMASVRRAIAGELPQTRF